MNGAMPNEGSNGKPISLKARRLGIDTLDEAHVFLHETCPVSRAEGFTAHSQVLVAHGERAISATLYHVRSDIVACNEAGLSDAAWRRLGLKDGGDVTVVHPPLLESLSDLRGKVYGRRLRAQQMEGIVRDVAFGQYSNIHLSAFVTACAARPLDHDEICGLTAAMVKIGDRIDWGRIPIVDKHCIGGLPGNRTTPILVSIAAACGLIIPKTSSRAITSPAGTADMMETLAPVNLSLADMRRVVERVGGCIVWGGAVHLSPTDDTIIRVERALDLDGEGQLVASILSKKIAAGATHLVLDMPVGATAKVRTLVSADILSRSLIDVAKNFGLNAKVILTDGTQPVGRGIGPALEAKDVLSVLKNEADAPGDLKARALQLAGPLLEMGGAAPSGRGAAMAAETLAGGAAWRKFLEICGAQGGFRLPPSAAYTRPVTAERSGTVTAIDNRRLSKVAKLAGAPEAKAAGVEIQVRLGDDVARGQPLYTVHAESTGELAYALNYAGNNPNIVTAGP